MLTSYHHITISKMEDDILSPIYSSIDVLPRGREPPLRLTCVVRRSVGVPGAGVSFHGQLHGVGEGPVAHLVGGGHLDQVHLARQQVLQQRHREAPCPEKWWTVIISRS